MNAITVYFGENDNSFLKKFREDNFNSECAGVSIYPNGDAICIESYLAHLKEGVLTTRSRKPTTEAVGLVTNPGLVPSKWVSDCGYGQCHMDITDEVDVLYGFLPAISNSIGKSVGFDVEVKQANSRHIGIEPGLPFVAYRIYVDGECVFEKNTLADGSVLAIRREMSAYIARLIRDYYLFLK